jgi:hypothetical protein
MRLIDLLDLIEEFNTVKERLASMDRHNRSTIPLYAKTAERLEALKQIELIDVRTREKAPAVIDDRGQAEATTDDTKERDS